MVKTSNTPEKATPPVVSAPQNTSPTKVASPLKSVNEKSKTPEKKVFAVQSKKRHHDESDVEEEVQEGNFVVSFPSTVFKLLWCIFRSGYIYSMFNAFEQNVQTFGLTYQFLCLY